MSHSPSPHPALSWWRERRHLVLSAVVGVAVLVLGLVAAMAFSGSAEDGTAPVASTGAAQQQVQAPAPPAPPPPPAPAEEGGLPESTTHTTIEAAPIDTAPPEATDGTVVHPTSEVLVHDTPGGTPFATVGPEQVGDTWLPVIAEQPGWVQVLLPSRPTGSTGWLADAGLERAVSPNLIRVHLGSMTLELFEDGERVGEWTVGIGKESAPTPPGRTFLLGSFTDPQQDYSPVILPLGTHSPTLDSFGGGPGTVAIHTWPTDDVFGTASSDGCIRVPSDALDQLTRVPLGSLVLIDEQ